MRDEYIPDPSSSIAVCVLCIFRLSGKFFKIFYYYFGKYDSVFRPLGTWVLLLSNSSYSHWSGKRELLGSEDCREYYVDILKMKSVARKEVGVLPFSCIGEASNFYGSGPIWVIKI